MDDTRIIVCPFLDSLSAFYTWHDVHADPLLQTDNVAHSSLETEQLLSAHALTSTQRGLCTEKFFFTQTPLHTEAFMQRDLYTQKHTLWPNLHCCRLNSCASFCFLFLITYLPCSPSQVRCIIPGLQHHTGARIHRALQEAVCHTMLSYPGNPWHHLSHLFPWFFLLCDILRFTSASKYPVKFLSTAAAFSTIFWCS